MTAHDRFTIAALTLILPLACTDPDPGTTADAASEGTTSTSTSTATDTESTPTTGDETTPGTTPAMDTGSESSSGDSDSGDPTGDTDGLAGQYVLPDDQFPESGTYDPVARAFFVGSLSRESILRVDADGAQSDLFVGAGDPERVSLGMKVDTARNRLWVCTILNTSGYPGTVRIIDTVSGEMLDEYVLEDTFPGASCNDIAVDPAGRALVTDRENPNIYQLDFDANTAAIWATDVLLAPEILGLNGIAFTPDGSRVIVTKYLPGKLLRLAATQPGEIAEISLSGAPFVGLGGTDGADGLVFVDDALYVAFGADVMQVTPTDATWAAATVKAQRIGTGYSAVTLAEGDLYAIRGQPAAFLLGLPPALPFDILRMNLGKF